MNDKELKTKLKFTNLLTFYIIFSLITVFTKAVFPPYFLQHGLTMSQILTGTLFGFVGALALVVLKASNFIHSRKAWYLSLIFFALYIALIISVNSVWQFYFASLLNGFSMYFFFIYYNVAHFKNTEQDQIGSSSAVMFSVGPIVSVFTPLIAGFLASINYSLIWVFSALLFAWALSSVRKQNDFTVEYSIASSLKEIEATRMLVLLEGVWEALIFGVIPIYTLFFIKSPLNYGIYIAYLSLASVVANLTLGKVTDKIQKRVVFLYPVTIFLALTTLLFTFVTKNIVIWVVLTGVIQLFSPLFWNISTAMTVDCHPNLELAMPAREGMLNIGRIIGLMAAVFSFTLEKSPFYIFIFLAGVMFIYPLILRKQIKKNKYPFL